MSAKEIFVRNTVYYWNAKSGKGKYYNKNL